MLVGSEVPDLGNIRHRAAAPDDRHASGDPLATEAGRDSSSGANAAPPGCAAGVPVACSTSYIGTGAATSRGEATAVVSTWADRIHLGHRVYI